MLPGERDGTTEGSGSSLLNGATNEAIYGDGWWYPRSWVTPDGRVFGMNDDKEMYYLDPTGNGSITPVGTFAGSGDETATSVMYDRGKILHIGGEGSLNNQASIIDVNETTPVISSGGTSNYRRVWADSTVLPDGTVLVAGGSSRYNDPNSQIAYAAEIWNPQDNSWTVVDSTDTPRLYHSTQLLLPDGRVLMAGGNTPGLDAEALTGEVYTPGYLYDNDGTLAERPTITSGDTTFDWGENIALNVGDGQNISRVTMVGFGAVTHSFDMGQRFLELDFTQNGNELTINAPESANVAPPGYYMVFAIDENGVPSESQIVSVCDCDPNNAALNTANTMDMDHRGVDHSQMEMG